MIYFLMKALPSILVLVLLQNCAEVQTTNDSGGSSVNDSAEVSSSNRHSSAEEIESTDSSIEVDEYSSVQASSSEEELVSSSAATQSSAAMLSSRESVAPSIEKYEVDFGAQVEIFDTSMSMESIQARIDEIYAEQKDNEFSASRYALLFKPGIYDLVVNIGYYTHVAGLGLLPGDVVVRGAVQSVGKESSGNVTTQFWRVVENIEIRPTNDADWLVSQAAPYRRMHVKGDLYIDRGTGYASGGFIANCVIDGTVTAYTQQQWFTRNSTIGNWSGVNWNVMWLGVDNAHNGWANALAETTVDQTPAVREKPFIYSDSIGNYNVLVPDISYNSRGANWVNGPVAGKSIALKDFFVAHPDDAVQDINAALQEGKHLILSPGIYTLSETIEIEKPNTVVLGLGLSTLVPQHGGAALEIADVGGVVIAGVVIDGGPINSPSLLTVGEEGASGSHSDNPTTLNDIFCRIGGQFSGRADRCITINSSDVLADHFWLWRADHGNGVNWDAGNRGSNFGWNENPSKNGLVVNGNDVKVYGLFNEHFQEYQTLWNGDRGETYFYQSEIPYDPESFEAWNDNGSPGYAAYKVADQVNEHKAWGLGMYAFFHHAVHMENAMETPQKPGIEISNIVTVTFSGAGGTIKNVINGQGGLTQDGDMRLTEGYRGE